VPDLGDAVSGSEVEEVGHHRNDVRLRGGLPVADGERPVDVGGGDFPRRHEGMARHLRQRRHDTVEKPRAPCQRPGVEGVGLDLLDEAPARLGKRAFVNRPRHGDLRCGGHCH